MDKLFEVIKKIRSSKDLKQLPNPYLRPEIQLRNYQKIAVANMVLISRSILGDATGLGKTIEILDTYAYFLSKDKNYKLLVICPSSAMYQWQSEIDKFYIGITSQIVEAVDIKVGKIRLKSFASREYQFNKFIEDNKNIVIFNYNTLITDLPFIIELVKKYKFMVVFDEVTAFKSNKTQTWLAASELSKNSSRVYGLSATIIKNNLMEAWAIYKAILPELFSTDRKFKNDYCILEKIQLWKGLGKKGLTINKIIGYKNLEHFKKMISPVFLGRKKSEVSNELPSIIANEVIIRMTEEQQKLYDDALSGFLDFSKFVFNDKFKHLIKEEIKQIDKLVALIYCQQICNSPHIIGIKAPSAKEAELLRMLECELSGEKVVIYTRFKKMIDRLEELISKKLGMKSVKITGDVDNFQREQNKISFNESEDVNIILINSAAKEALNLQSSGYLIFFDLPFSYGDFLQIIGRIHRIGNKHENISLIYLLCKDTIDEKILRGILSSKKDLFDAVLGDSAIGAIIKSDDFVDSLFSKMKEDALRRLR